MLVGRRRGVLEGVLMSVLWSIIVRGLGSVVTLPASDPRTAIPLTPLLVLSLP